jgi:hypothetical protein
MEVICLEDVALEKLIRAVVSSVKDERKISQPKWIAPQNAMELLNCKKSSLQTLRMEGRITYTQPTKKIILYNYESIMKYLDGSAKEAF